MTSLRAPIDSLECSQCGEDVHFDQAKHGRVKGAEPRAQCRAARRQNAPIRGNGPLSPISRPFSCGNTLAAKPDSCALSPIAQLRFSMKGALSPTSVYGQVPDDAMPL